MAHSAPFNPQMRKILDVAGEAEGPAPKFGREFKDCSCSHDIVGRRTGCSRRRREDGSCVIVWLLLHVLYCNDHRSCPFPLHQHQSYNHDVDLADVEGEVEESETLQVESTSH